MCRHILVWLGYWPVVSGFPNRLFYVDLVPCYKGRNHEKRRERTYNLDFILILIYFEKYNYRWFLKETHGTELRISSCQCYSRIFCDRFCACKCILCERAHEDSLSGMWGSSALSGIYICQKIRRTASAELTCPC